MARRSVVSPRGSAGGVIATPKAGTSIQWNSFEMPGYRRINLRGNAKSPKFARGQLTSGQRQVFRGVGSTFHVEMHLIGWRTLIADQYAVASLVPSLAAQVTGLAGAMVRDSALQDKTWTDRTYKHTRNSMLDDPVMVGGGGDIIAEMGPTTYYAPFLEFGWQKGGYYYAYPFMIPALDKHTIDFINGHIDVMGIVAGERPFAMRPPMQGLTRSIGKARSFLYTNEKALGDIVVVSGSKYIGPLRGAMLSAAKELGDLSAVMQGNVVRRIATRITGAVTGRALGYSRTVSVSKTYSGTPGGQTSVGGRVYNRVAGRATRPIATGLFN